MTEHPAAPTTRRGKAVLSEMPDRIRGPWTPFREEQWGGTIATIEAEARVAARKEVLDEIRLRTRGCGCDNNHLTDLLDSLSTDTREEPT